MDRLKQLRQERAALYAANEDLFKAIEADNRVEPTDDEQRQLDANIASISEYDAKIEAAEKLAEQRAANMAKLNELRTEVGRVSKPQPVKHHPLPEDEKRTDIQFKRIGKLKAFLDDYAAYKTGMALRAQVFGDHRAAQWLRDQGVELRAHSEGIATAGGVLVPEEFVQSIIDLRETYGVFRQYARVMPMSRDTAVMPRRTGGLSAYWVDEAGSITESSKTWDNVRLTAKKLGIYSLISSELAEDAIVNLADDLASECAYEFALTEDNAGFNGDGTATYAGILGVCNAIEANSSLVGYVDAATSGHDTFAEVDATDLATVMSKLPLYARPGAAWYCSQVAYDLVFSRLAIAAGGNTLDTVTGAYMPRYLGYPIRVSQVMESSTSTINDTTMLLFGDLSKAATLGDRRSMDFATSSDFKFQNDQIAIRAIERIDINVHDIGDTSTAGPIVALIGKTS